MQNVLRAILGLILIAAPIDEVFSQALTVIPSHRPGANQPQNYVDVRTDFGAVCDGTVDDTAALNAAFTFASTNNLAAILPSGVCKFTSALRPLIGHDIRIEGIGAPSVLEYAGSSAAPGDLLVLGDGTKTYQNVYLRGFTIGSSTMLSSGAALRIRKSVNVHVDLVVNGKVGQQGKLWDGIWFEKSSTVNLHGSRIYTQNNGVIANEGSELHFNHAWIAGSKTPAAGTGIHIAGGYGGVYTENLTQQNNDIGMLVDTSLSRTGNTHFFIQGTFDSNRTAAAKFDDRSRNPLSKVIYANGWFASSTAGSGFVIANWTEGSLTSTSGVFINNARHGLVLDDPSVHVVLAFGTDISKNYAYGVAASAAISIQSNAVPHRNAKGAYGPGIATSTRP